MSRFTKFQPQVVAPRNPRHWEDIPVGDTLHWAGSVAGYQLDKTDTLSLYYTKAEDPCPDS